MSRNSISVLIQKKSSGVSARWVIGVLEAALESHKSEKYFVSVLVTGDPEIRKINRDHLGHDCATDVVSFEPGKGGSARAAQKYLGDVVVSVDTARAWARELGIPYREELARYLVHGTLHLLGYDDRSDRLQQKMFRVQEKVLKKLFPAMTAKGSARVPKN